MILVIALTGCLALSPLPAQAADFVVYGMYRPLDLGNPEEKPEKDYYINMGSSNGLKVGAVVEVLRRSPTYDILSEKLFKDITFPIAQLKIVHVESNAAVARLAKMRPVAQTPMFDPRAIMVGDLVQASR